MKSLIMKYTLGIIISLAFFSCFTLNAQEESTETPSDEQEQVDNRPVRGWFETGQLIDNQTPIQPLQGGLELLIHHRMGKIEKINDLFGLYSASNIRLGLDYGVTDKMMVGFGTEKDNKLQEFRAKYQLMQQTRSGSVPLSVSLYGNMTIDGREKANFEGFNTEYRFIHRISYFSQVILARKFSERIALQAAPSFVYFNAVPEKYSNMNVGISAGGKVKIANQWGLIFEYDQSFLTSDVDDAIEPKPNVGIGFEKGTATHCFQLFASSYRGISPQYDLGMNENDFFNGGIHVGFNITVRF